MRDLLIITILIIAVLFAGCKNRRKKSAEQKMPEKKEVIQEYPEKESSETAEQGPRQKAEGPEKEGEAIPAERTLSDIDTTRLEAHTPELEQIDKSVTIKKMLSASYNQIDVGPRARFYERNYPKGNKILWVSSVDRISKIDISDNNFKLINQLPIVGIHLFSKEEIDNLNKSIDKLSSFDELIDLHNKIKETYSLINPVSSYMHENGYLYIAHDKNIYAYGDEQERFASSAAEMKLTFRIPRKILKTEDEHIIALNRTPKKKFIFLTNKGTLALIDSDLRKPLFSQLPEDELFANEFAFDKSGGIYLTSDKAVYRIVEEEDGILTSGSNTFRSEHGETPGAVPGPPLIMNVQGENLIIAVVGKDNRKLIVLKATAKPVSTRILSKVGLGHSVIPDVSPANCMVFSNKIIVFINRQENNKVKGILYCFEWDSRENNILKRWSITKNNIFSFPILIDNQRLMTTTLDNNTWQYEFIDVSDGSTSEYLPLGNNIHLLPTSPQIFSGMDKRLFYVSPMRLTEMIIEN